MSHIGYSVLISFANGKKIEIKLDEKPENICLFKTGKETQ